MSQKYTEYTPPQSSFKGNHSEYFASLENKLLEESDALTNFMGKSLITEKSLKQLKHNISSNTLIKQAYSQSGTLSNRNQAHRPSDNYIERAKQLVRNIKVSKGAKDRPKLQKNSSKDKYQHLRKVVYNVCNATKQKEQGLGKSEQKPAKSRKVSKTAQDIMELKDTASTQGGVSSNCLSQQALPWGQDKVKLDDFVPIKMLGQGKMGQVCLVKHKKTGFLFALKEIVQSHISTDPKMLTQLIRQIKIQSFLDHPNIAQLYSVFVEDNNLYLLLQLCADGDMYHHLKQEGSFPQDKIRLVIKQICYAVEYMHDNDILHRDLKPQNILFHENFVKICDFGWAVHSPLLRNTLCGTPLYSSPELVQKQQYDNKIDIWNIGILTYELVYSRVPFEIRHEQDIVKVVEEEIYFPRNKPASPQIKDFMLRCLSKNPKERYSVLKLIDHQFLNPEGTSKII